MPVFVFASILEFCMSFLDKQHVVNARIWIYFALTPVGIMPKALAKIQLSTLAPSPQELLDARAHLAALSPQQMASKKGKVEAVF